MQAPITAIYAAALSLLVIILAGRVVYGRRTERVGLGDGDSRFLRKAIRVHANAVENLPFTLVLMLLLELNSAPGLLLHIAGSATVLARLLHAAGLSKTAGTSMGRVSGAALTWLVIIMLACANLWYVL